MERARTTSCWRDQLHPIRLADGRIEEQLRKYFWTMTVGSSIFGLIGSIILAIFTGFGRVDTGLELVATVFLFPCVLIWSSYFRLRRRVKLYLRESGQPVNNDAPPV